MTDNFSDYRSPGSNFSELEKHRKAIENVEYVFESTMPGTFTVEALIEFGAITSDAIMAIRKSNNQIGQNEEDVLNRLRQARQYMQLAIDEFEPVRNKKARYQCIASAGKELREALSYWQIY